MVYSIRKVWYEQQYTMNHRALPRHYPHAGTRWPLHVRVVGLTLLFLGYFVILALIYPQVGVIAASLSVVPIIGAGLLFGRRGGVLASLASIPLHALLFGLVAPSGWAVVLHQWPGSVMGIVVGVAAGWLSAFVGNVQGQAEDLQREREALQAEIAERIRIESMLLQAQHAAEAANSAKSAFLANMSHELRTPLSAILGFSDLMRMQAVKRGDEAIVGDLDYILKAGHHLLNLINDVLDLGKVEAGKMELHPEQFMIELLVHEVASFVQTLMQKNDNTLQIVAADQLGVMYTDRSKVQQVLLNLLSNAAKFTSHGTITLAVFRERRAEEDWICFDITDTGVGIAEEHIGKLFQPFTQLFVTTTQDWRGTGLGLALSQRFCDLMGGSVDVRSTPNVGSTFSVRLPAAVPEARAEAGTVEDAPLLQRSV